MYMVDICIPIWNKYLECINKYNPESNLCKPLIQEYNQCVFYNEREYMKNKSKIIEKQCAVKVISNYWSLENVFVWWSL